MIVRRRTWSYRLSGDEFAKNISFNIPLTAQKARESLHRLLGAFPVELWGIQTTNAPLSSPRFRR